MYECPIYCFATACIYSSTVSTVTWNGRTVEISQLVRMWKGRELLQPKLRYYPKIFLDRLKKITIRQAGQCLSLLRFEPITFRMQLLGCEGNSSVTPRGYWSEVMEMLSRAASHILLV